MADSRDVDATSIVAAHQPPHVYMEGHSYGASFHQAVPPRLRSDAYITKIVDGGEEDDDEYLDDIFDDDDDYDDGTTNITKNYNRQRQFHDGSTAKPRSNPQKPLANTILSVDDQMSTLAKHAAKIRLGETKSAPARDKDKADRATSEQVLDQRTRMILLQMINRDVISEVHGAISTGKEANVYGAVAYPNSDDPPVQRAVKVYKTAILVFKDRERYITGEHRFKSGAEKGNSRKMVKQWAEKEFRNLRRIHSAGILCPEPIQLKLHVLVMELLGDRKGWAYPRLRDANIAGDNSDQVWRALYLQLVGIMRRLYQVCKLVHADLSEYNILYNDEKLYVIDVSQSVEHDHPRSLEFLRMDIKNTGDFFKKQGVDILPDRTIFYFVVATEGAVTEPALSEAIERFYETRDTQLDDDDGLAKEAVDTEVFRNQYIPQTLNQVYDMEKDSQQIGAGHGDQLVYKALLAGLGEHGQKSKEKNGQGASDQGNEESSEELDGSDEDGSDEGVKLHGDEEDDDESRFEKGTPRGKRFEDKDAKKQHKQAIKEEKREKRKEKMPKYVKKKLVSSTSKRKQ